MGLEDINTDLFEVGDSVYISYDLSYSVWRIAEISDSYVILYRILSPSINFAIGDFSLTVMRTSDLRPVDDFEFWVRQVRYEASKR